MKPFRWTPTAVADALGIEATARGRAASAGPEFSSVATDTRTLPPGSLFVALEGDRFDGHAFLTDAVRSGASGAVVSKVPDEDPGVPLYEVPDTLVALGLLARYRRRAHRGQVVAITGSSGKTTVKELVTAALGAAGRVHATTGNLNNRVGLPLTVLRAPDEADYLVVEAGTSEPGEIERLSAIAEPDHVIVTTVTEAHLSGLGSFEGVLEEKLDLVRGARPGGIVLVGDEPEVLGQRAKEIRADTQIAGLSPSADEACRGGLESQFEDGTYRVRFADHVVHAGIPGVHGARNLVVALSLARLLDIPLDAAAERAATVRPLPMRGEVRRVGALTLLLDCYNANPQSVIAALELLAGLPGDPRRVAVLGSMLELGARSSDLHRSVLEHACGLPIDLVIASGEFAGAVRGPGLSAVGPEVVPAATVDDAYAALKPRIRGSETVLLKGSRGVALERLVDRLVADFGVSAPEPAPRGADGAPEEK